MTSLAKDIWGPALWQFLHITAASIEDVDAFVELLRSLTKTIPCPDCRKHLKQHLIKFPPEEYIINSINANTYMFILHNMVNERIGNPIFSDRVYNTLYGPLNYNFIPKHFIMKNVQAPSRLKHGTMPFLDYVKPKRIQRKYMNLNRF